MKNVPIILKITNDDLNVELKFKKETVVKNVNNDLLKDLPLNLTLQLGSYNNYYSYIKDNLKKSNEKASSLVLSSHLCFNNKVPPMEVNMNNPLSLEDDLDTLENVSNNICKRKLETIYYCNDIIDVLSAILFHFSSLKYDLKFCPICKNFFLTNKKRNIICSKECVKKNNSQRELKRVNNNPVIKLDKMIRDILNVRNTDEIDTYIEDFENIKIKFKNDNKKIENWLKQTHSSYLVRKKEKNDDK